MPLVLAVALLSAATLLYEILLVRIFAIEYFHHFAYMAIGVAMLGIGAAGTCLALVPPPDDGTSARWLRRAAAMAVLALVASPALAHRVALDPTRLTWDPGQWGRLGGVFFLLTLPFAAGALAMLLALGLERERPGRLYGASFAGSAAGAALAVAALWILPPDRALGLAAPLAGAAALILARSPLALATTGLAILALVHPLWRPVVTPYKGLPQVEAYPEAHRVAERTSPVGWVVAVRAPAFRYAPGLSLGYSGPFPAQTALFVDGALTGATSDWQNNSLAAELLDWLPTALPYVLPGRERVLVIGSGGGTDVWSAAAHGAREVVALELSPDVVELARGAAPRPGARTARVDWVTGDARSYLERSALRFDLVTLGPGGGPGTSAAGVHALNEDFLHTVEAYATYLAHLDPDGVLAVTSWLTVPPREAVRTILTSAAAVRRRAPAAVEGGLVVARGWGTATVLVKPSGFTGTELQALKGWARQRHLDLDWYPGLDRPVSEFNLLADPDLFRAARAAVAGPAAAAQFGNAYSFAVAPVSDGRPYPHHFLRPGSLAAFLREARGTWLPFAEWGYVALVATLGQSAFLAALLLLAPAVAGGRGPAGLARLLSYFGALGLGYLAAELAMIQTLGLLLGHPVYAVAATLVAFLVCSGAGSSWSDRVPSRSGRMALALVTGVLLLLAAGLLTLVHLAQPAPWPVRLGLALLACLPAATMMGMAFPLGLRRLVAGERSRLAWAWAANGFASVVAAPLAALVALELGSRAVLALAAGAYGVAWLAFPAARTDWSTPSASEPR